MVSESIYITNKLKILSDSNFLFWKSCKTPISPFSSFLCHHQCYHFDEEWCSLIVRFSPFFYVDHFYHFGAAESWCCSLVALQVLLQFGCSSFWWPANEPAGEQCTQVLTSKDKGQNQKYCTGTVILFLQNCCRDTRYKCRWTLPRCINVPSFSVYFLATDSIMQTYYQILP